jgi:hypothetical protein
MSSLQRHGPFGGRLWRVALTGATLALAAAGPSGALAATAGKHHRGKAQPAQQTPDQVIDAQANPDAAADALNSGCEDTSKCSWKSDTALTSDYGPPSILGDVLYNCSDDEYAETAVGVQDERQESTSVSERVSLKVSLSFLDLEKSSAEFSAFSKQSESFTTLVKITNAVPVPPGYKGWSVTEILSGNVTGSTYITQGINKLIQVKNIDLSFPGYQDPDNPQSQVNYSGVKTRMNADDIKAACDTSTVSGAALLRTAQGPPRTFKLGLCRRSGRCTSREVAGSPPRGVRRASALLTRAGRAYGRGTYARGRTQLHMRRPLKAGTYKLTLRERPAKSQQIGTGPLSAIETIVPITIG